MRTIYFIIQKEFSQFFRDKANIQMLLIMPIIQLILLPMAANYEVKNIQLFIIDFDHSSYSSQMIQKITSSGYIQLAGIGHSYKSGMEALDKDKADILLEIPVGFEKTLIREDEITISASVNAVNGQRASLGAQYLLTILKDFNQEIRTKWVQFPKFKPVPIIQIDHSYWYNPFMNYKQFMVPGILVILLTMIGANMSALNLVKEKEIGTIEQINVSPIRKHHFIIGKLIPFWILGQVVLSIGLMVAWLVYGIIPVGHISLIYLFSSVYLLAILGLGLLISTIAHTQQQAMLISFFIMMIFVLLSGLYTSIDSMPKWAQFITKLNPIAYFVQVMRMVIMKGSGFKDILPHLLSVLGMAIVLIPWAVWNYRKKS
ncbi:MAG: ABC transporter permease [Saprospiraceae bacterium]|nr:ABC transporter permease [Saprospiraceae bacterium]MBK8484685.1 ABC transporter permease [Saprospiraceae bacterium]MBK9222110.1 ABC transporter permease [Saprospiraceae bacterium]MBK9720981.1 ABC transporter permease [Saprospiraceae bacterium]MBK9727974.1 ABC transporter permease [Saprospiraceae bacterium]